MKALFIANRKHLNAPIPGGVQICTNEFLQLFRDAGFDLNIFPVETTTSFVKRLKIKLGINAYDFFNFDKYIETIEQVIRSDNIKFIIINQVNLCGFAKLLKKKFGEKVKVIVLSHGNGSGDYLREVLDDRRNFLSIYTLGKLLLTEAVFFSKYVDLLVTISEVETSINKWLGALNCIYIPRTIPDEVSNWSPVNNSIGVVGSLHHPPNLKGIEMLAQELDKLKFSGNFNIIGGPEELGVRLEKKYNCIKYIGFVSNEKMKEEVSTWSLFANTIFWYSRGASTKLAQIIAWGIPIISTEAGIRGYEWEKGDVHIANSPEKMAKEIIELLNSREKINDLHKNILSIKKTSPTMLSLKKIIKERVLEL